ncbi:hypothetical protein PM082_003516 [Marasmius tenuissimus]|nr:hypothetical protein PM082_003516 [Marasmius tenuissimus]
MAYHKSFQGYHNSNEPLSGSGFSSGADSFKHGTQGIGLAGQDRSSGNCDAPASIYSDVPSGTVPRNDNSNHVTGLHNATQHSNLANHFGNLSVAPDVPGDDKTHLPIAPLQLHFPPTLPLPSQTRSSFPPDAMQQPSYQHHNHHHHYLNAPVPDTRSYQQYPMSFSYGTAASLPMMPEASTSQHKLPGNYGANPFCDIAPGYSDTRYVSGAMPQETSDFLFQGGEDDDVEYESDGYGLEREIYESSDMELDSDAYRHPPQPQQPQHHAWNQFQAPHPPQTQSCFKLTPSECDPEWYSGEISPEGNGVPYPWRTAGKDQWQQPDSLGPPWGQVEAFHSDDILTYHQNHGPESSSHRCDYDYDARNTTPSDISSSASPLSPIDGLTYPVSHIHVPESSHLSSIATQAPYPHSMSGIAYGGYDPTLPVKSDDNSEVASSAPFIAAFLNGNGFANSTATAVTTPVLHAPRPVRPIPTVSFEDLAASISDVQK